MNEGSPICVNTVLKQHHRESDTNRDTILCADDSMTIRELMKMVFERVAPDFRVEEAMDGEEAITKISGEAGGKIAAVFTDINMPRKSGLDLAHAISGKVKDERLRKDLLEPAPIIICSGSSGDYLTPGAKEFQIMQDLKHQGVIDSIIEKPFLINQLEFAVFEAVRATHRRIKMESRKSA